VLAGGCNNSPAPADKPAPPPGPAATVKPAGDAKKPDADQKPAEPKPAPEVGLGPARFKAAADELYAEQKKDPKAFVDKYNNAVVEVSGQVGQIFWVDEDNGQRELELQVKDELTGLTCQARDVKRSATLGKGQTVRLKGRLKASTDSVRVIDGELVEVGPDTAVRTTAEDLAKEFTSGWKMAKKKFANKTLIVAGVIAEKPKGEGDTWTARLKGDDTTVIVCELLRGQKTAAEKLDAGQRVTIAGAFSGFNTGPGQAALINAILVEGP
jgi:hypothetical protein